MAIKAMYFYYNVDKRWICNSDGYQITTKSLLPQISYTQSALLCLTCIDNEGDAFAFNATDVFSWAADNDWASATEVKMRTDDDGINSGLWAEEDPTLGKISILIDANTTDIRDWLVASAKKDIIGELQVREAGEEIAYYFGYMDMVVRNIIDHSAVDPTAVEGSTYSKAEVDALIALCASLALFDTTYSVIASQGTTETAESVQLTEATVLGRLTGGQVAALNRASLLTILALTTGDISGLVSALAGKVAIAGDTMSGDLNMAGNNLLDAAVVNLDNATNDMDIAVGEAGYFDRLDFIAKTTDKGAQVQVVPDGTNTKAKWSLLNSSDLFNFGSVFLGLKNTIAYLSNQTEGTGTEPTVLRIGTGPVDLGGNATEWSEIQFGGPITFDAEDAVAIVSGVATPTNPVVKFTGEGAAADDLTEIDTVVGFLYARNNGNTITIKDHGSDVANKIRTIDSNDLTLDDNGWVILYRRTTSDVWRVIGGSGSVVLEDAALSNSWDADTTKGATRNAVHDALRKRVAVEFDSGPIDLTQTGTHNVYTVPTGWVFFPEEFGIFLVDVDGVGSQPSYKFGLNTSLDCYLSERELNAEMNSEYDREVHQKPHGGVSEDYIIQFTVTVGSGSTTFVGVPYVKGWMYKVESPYSIYDLGTPYEGAHVTDWDEVEVEWDPADINS